jgi:hypothetical protein
MVLGGPQIASLWPRFGCAVVDRHDSAVFGCAGSAPAAAGVLADRVGER